MSLYDKDNPHNEVYRDYWRRRADKVQAGFDAAYKARDPLAYYWKKGVHNLRDTFGKLLDFRPEPGDFYDEGKYR